MKVVKYRRNPNNLIKAGFPAFIQPINHPSDLVSNNSFARTSIVQHVGKHGGFITENTMYIPHQEVT